MEELLLSLGGNSSIAIYAIAFGILLACGFGLPLPEDVILLSLGYLSYLGVVDIHESILVAMFGVLIGDSAIFMLGRKWGTQLLQYKFFRILLPEKRIEKVREAFRKDSKLYLFFARFAPGLRAVTFWSAGTFGVPYRRFLFFDGTAALLSVPLITYAGLLVGETYERSKGDIQQMLAFVGGMAILVIAIVIFKRAKRNRQS